MRRARFRDLLVLVIVSIVLLLIYIVWVTMTPEPIVPPTLSPTVEAPIDTMEDLLRRDFWSREWEMCDEPRRLPIYYNNEIWQHPFNSSYFLLSAYPDRRLRAEGQLYSYVRILAMRDSYHRQTVFCQLWYERGRVSSVLARVELMWERRWDPPNDNRFYDPVLISCPLRGGRIPVNVAVTSSPCQPADTMLRVDRSGLDTWIQRRVKEGFAVCVKGLDFEEDISKRLVEWIELNRLLGADQIYVYHFRSPSNVLRVLNHYSSEGLVTVLNMTLPGFQPNFPPDRSRYQRAAVWQKRRNEIVHYNDCLYRSLYIHKFIIPVDVDEVIVPLKFDTWRELMDHLEDVNKLLLKRFAAFSARNVYFFDNLTRTLSDPNLPQYFHMLNHKWRSANHSEAGISGKSIVSTRGALAIFNHYPLNTLFPYMEHEARIITAQAQLNHYKAACPPALREECANNFHKYTVQDHSLDRFKSRLVPAVTEVVERLAL